MNTHIVDLEEIKKTVKPIAEKYKLKSVYIFGSYARNEANEDSDIDILIDREGSQIHGAFDFSALFDELKQALGKEIDLVTVQSLNQSNTVNYNADFVKKVMREKVKIFG